MKSKAPRKITISIACFNKLEFTKQCLEAIQRNTNPELFALNIVDNASTDGTFEFFKNEFPKWPIFKQVPITIMRNNENIGFARAHNMSFLECKSPYFLLLNNDTIPLKGWLEPIIEVFENRLNVAVIGSKLISPILNAIQHAGVSFINGLPKHLYFGMPEDFPLANISTYVPSVTGALMAVRSDVYEKLDRLDSKYRNGWEDTDFNMKVRQAGLDIYYEARSVAYHYEGQTEGRLNDDDSNRELFFSRWSLAIREWGNKVRIG